jgi:hypothetical protein
MTQAVNLAKLGSSGGPTIDSSGNITTTGVVSMASSFMRNRIINGDMRIDQRNAGASVTQNTSGIYTVDRWCAYGSANAKFTIQRNAASVTPPAGFTNYAGCTSSSAYTAGAAEEFDFYQYIEGYNIADLAWGTANAKTVTLSFWVRSSLTGTFGAQIANYNSSRSYPFSYTISSANTWEQKTVTITGDTTGTWYTDNSAGMLVNFSLGAGSSKSGTANTWQAGNYTQPTGSTSVVGTSGATFYITGVQLEIGTSATPFERRLYGQELMNCQRYYEILYTILCAYGNGSNGVYASVPMKVSKRATPTGVVVSTDSEVNVVGSVTLASGGTTDRNPHTIMLTYTGAPSTGFTRAGANITLSAEL